jgi:Calcineurin-like phosphoesterase
VAYSHIARTIVAVLALLTVAASSFRTPPAHAQSPEKRIVAIADIHGAADQFVEILKAAGLIDASQRWVGGTTTLVQTGDYFDRGPGIRRILDLLMRLEDEARRAGGRLEVLLGNHEVMNLLREFRDVSPETFASFADEKSEERRKKAFEEYAGIIKRTGGNAESARDGWMTAHPSGFVEYVDALAPKSKYGRWLRERKVVLKLDDTIFMHAGLSPATQGSLDDVNRSVETALESWDMTTDEMTKDGLIRPFFTLKETVEAAATELQRITAALKAGQSPGEHVTRESVGRLDELMRINTSPLLAGEGPLWFRGLAQWTSPDADEQVTALLSRFGVKRFVIGHTPSLPGKITPHFGGRVIPIDTGMLSSFFKSGRASALEIQGGRLTAIYTTEREVLSPAEPR